MPEEQLRRLLRLVDAIERFLYDIIGLSSLLRKYKESYRKVESTIKDVFTDLAGHLDKLVMGFPVDSDVMKKELDRVSFVIDDIEERGISAVDGVDISDLHKFIHDIRIFIETYDWTDDLDEVKRRLNDVRDFLDPALVRILDVPLEDLSLKELTDKLRDFIDKVDKVFVKLFEVRLKEQKMSKEKEKEKEFVKKISSVLSSLEQIDIKLDMLSKIIFQAYDALKGFARLEKDFKQIFTMQSFNQLQTMIRDVIEVWKYGDIFALVNFLKDKAAKLEVIKTRLVKDTSPEAKEKLENIENILNFSNNVIDIFSQYLSMISEVSRLVNNIVQFFEKANIPIETIDVKDKFVKNIDEIREFFVGVYNKIIDLYHEYIGYVKFKEVPAPEELPTYVRVPKVARRETTYRSFIDVPLSVATLNFFFDIFDHVLVITSKHVEFMTDVVSISVEIKSLPDMQKAWNKFIDKNLAFVKTLEASEEDLMKLSSLKNDETILEFFKDLIETSHVSMTEGLYLREPILEDVISVLEDLDNFIRRSKDVDQFKALLDSLKRKLKGFGKIKHQDRVIDVDKILELLSDIEYTIDITYGMDIKEVVGTISDEINNVIDKLSKEYLHVIR